MDEDDIQQVRQDLLWLVTAPPILRSPLLRWQPAHAFSSELVHNLPEKTLRALVSARSRTLGAYFEGLARALFEASPDFTVLAGNRIIQGARRTLGELDLLLRDHRSGQVIHLELALKFYLRLPRAAGEPVDDRHWIGAGLRDFLAVKHDRLLHHQLNLPNLARHHGCWPEDLPIPDRSLAWVTGRLYHPFEEPGVATSSVAPEALTGAWLTLSAFKQRTFEGHWVNKAGWLAPEPNTVEPTLKHPLPGQFLGTPFPGGPWRHWFVVPDDWPASARNRMVGRFQTEPEVTDGR